MRNDIFEADVVNQKLQAVFLERNGKANLIDLERGSEDFVEGFGRGNIAIMENILAICTEKQSKTKIKSKIKLSEAQTTRYLRYLVYQELLNQNKGRYVITHRGQSLLRLFVKLHNFFGMDHR